MKTKKYTINNLVGTKFGELEPLSETEPLVKYYKNGRHITRIIMCKCSCGEKVSITLGHLISGHSKSCGHETQKQFRYAHGFWKTKLYKKLGHMVQRCRNPKDRNYDRYGARGITICKEWLENSKSFIEWALSHGYEEGLEIDRIDNNKGYSPENCRFVTRRENSMNRNCIKLSSSDVLDIVNAKLLLGKSIPNTEIAKSYGVHPAHISRIIARGIQDGGLL